MAADEVPYGTLDLMVLKTLDTLGPLHGYAIAARLEQVSGGALKLNMGTLYPALWRLEGKGLVASEWGLSDNKRKAKFYRLTPEGRRRLREETKVWSAYAEAVGKLLNATRPPLTEEE